MSNLGTLIILPARTNPHRQEINSVGAVPTRNPQGRERWLLRPQVAADRVVSRPLAAELELQG
jgi:hypothetical protein